MTAAGYTHMRSQVGGHMVKCDKRPAGVSDAEVVEELDRLMAKMRGEES